MRGRPQRSATVPLDAYLKYYTSRCIADSTAGLGAGHAGPPFYLNGWRVLSAHPVCARVALRRCVHSDEAASLLRAPR